MFVANGLVNAFHSPGDSTTGRPPSYFSLKEQDMVRNKKGFTLIELLIVVVIIGILAAIAIPKFANTKEKAYVASMKADLRNLATYEESIAADSAGLYFGGTAAGTSGMQGFLPSQNVSVTATAVTGPPAGWTAVATHSLTTKTCSSSAQGLITCT
jgi:prepilin-type N-terminal cleavage/methylation domain-containing protein